MAKPIELVLTLDKEESKWFQQYLDNPQYTPEGRRLIRKAAELVKRSHL
jgi:uncharacterized protein (DUF1778 family)